MMSESAVDGAPSGVPGLVEDWASDKQAYNVPWGKAMMWIFLVSERAVAPKSIRKQKSYCILKF